MSRERLFIENFKFTAVREAIDEDGLWNPVIGDGPLAGGVQINLHGDRERFLRLSEYFRLMADAVGDHDHCEVSSEDGKTRLHFIVRAGADVR